MEVRGQLHALVALPLGKNPGSHEPGSWVRSRADVNVRQTRRICCRRKSNPGPCLYTDWHNLSPAFGELWTYTDTSAGRTEESCNSVMTPYWRSDNQNESQNNTGNVFVTMRRVRITVVGLKKKSNKHYIFWVCVCSLGYTACNAHAPYCRLWAAPLYNIFPHYTISGTIFGGGEVIVT